MKPINRKEAKALATLHRVEAAVQAGRQPHGNTIAQLQHGVLANSLLSQQERELFYALIARFQADYALNQSADFMQAELVILYFLQVGRAMRAKDWENAERLDRMLRGHLRDMKATKRAREGDAAPAATSPSPAEWATALLERVAATQAAERVVSLQQVAGTSLCGE